MHTWGPYGPQNWNAYSELTKQATELRMALKCPLVSRVTFQSKKAMYAYIVQQVWHGKGRKYDSQWVRGSVFRAYLELCASELRILFIEDMC